MVLLLLLSIEFNDFTSSIKIDKPVMTRKFKLDELRIDCYCLHGILKSVKLELESANHIQKTNPSLPVIRPITIAKMIVIPRHASCIIA